MKKNEHTPKDAPTQYSPEILHALLAACRTDTQKSLVSTVWNNRGILTHKLIQIIFYINLHSLSARVNNRIEPLGWHIVKVENQNRSKASAWYLAPLNTHNAGSAK